MKAARSNHCSLRSGKGPLTVPLKPSALFELAASPTARPVAHRQALRVHTGRGVDPMALATAQHGHCRHFGPPGVRGPAGGRALVRPQGRSGSCSWRARDQRAAGCRQPLLQHPHSAAMRAEASARSGGAHWLRQRRGPSLRDGQAGAVPVGGEAAGAAASAQVSARRRSLVPRWRAHTRSAAAHGVELLHNPGGSVIDLFRAPRLSNMLRYIGIVFLH
jgi:hypothetical protein